MSVGYLSNWLVLCQRGGGHHGCSQSLIVHLSSQQPPLQKALFLALRGRAFETSLNQGICESSPCFELILKFPDSKHPLANRRLRQRKSWANRGRLSGPDVVNEWCRGAEQESCAFITLPLRPKPICRASIRAPGSKRDTWLVLGCEEVMRRYFSAIKSGVDHLAHSSVSAAAANRMLKAGGASRSRSPFD